MPRRRAIDPERLSQESKPELGGAIVKSAQRVVEIFELFSDLQMGATVADVSAMLKTPQSSTSALLRSLHVLGYLDFNIVDRTYCPTGRLALLDCWADQKLVSQGPAIKMVREVTQKTGFSSYLVARNNLHVQLIFRDYGGGSALKTRNPNGSGSFITQSVAGCILLSHLPDRDVTKIVTAVNARLPEGQAPIRTKDVKNDIYAVRLAGYLTGPSLMTDGRTTLAFRLPDPLGERIAFGISVPSDTLAAQGLQSFVDLVRVSMNRWLPT